jgi:hypothetical protein
VAQNVVQNVVTEQGEPEPPAEESRIGERPPRMLRIRLWQAVAGMSVAIVLASLIVMSELAGSLARRTNYVNRRVAALNATVRTLRHQTAVEQRKLGSARELATVGEAVEKILFAPDLRIIKLAVPVEKDREKEKSGAPPLAIIGPPVGKLAMSETAGAAMLEASGLRPTGTFQVYRIWWLPKRGAPIWAADFLVGDDGLATATVDLPTGREKEMSVGITLEDESYSEAPNGPFALKGEAAAVSVMVQSPRKSRR